MGTQTSGTVVVWRHGQTQWNVANRFQGQSDIPLNDQGRTQAAQAADVLARRPVHTIVSSDLTRAIDTGAALAQLNGLTVTPDVALRETFAGSWEGLNHAEIRAQDGNSFDRWLTDHTVRPGGTGETIGEVGERVAGAIERYVGRQPHNTTLVVVTHGGSARAGIAHLLGWPVDRWRTMSVLKNCAWAVLNHQQGENWVLSGHNHTPDLPKKGGTTDAE